jgi:hypothetical protein
VSKETDISQISKYLNGALDAKAMHQLEKRALDDPFLMDAIEGYEANGKNQQMQLDEISDRLQKRLSGNEKRIIPWRYFAIAASVLVVFTIGGVFLFNNNAKRPQLAKLVVPVTQKADSLPIEEPKVNSDATAEKPNTANMLAKVSAPESKKVNYPAKSKGVASVSPAPPAPDAMVAEAKVAKADETADKDTTPLNEMIVTEYTSRKKKDITQNVVATNLMKVKKADTTAVHMLQGQVNGVAYNNVSSPRQEHLNLPGARSAEIVMLRKDSEPSKSVIKGQVVAAANGLPMPGATVKVAGTNVHTQTDANGYFKIPADSTKATLAVGYIGYETRKVAVNDKDSVNKISLYANNNSLAEVVVVSAPKAKRSAGIEAHPRNGWDSFRKYLDENAISPDKKTGTVTLSFSIDQNGVINNLQVKRGLSEPTNQKAISLISNGPAWVANSNGATQTVEVKIKFSK